jgi:hypothetical protein
MSPNKSDTHNTRPKPKIVSAPEPWIDYDPRNNIERRLHQAIETGRSKATIDRYTKMLQEWHNHPANHTITTAARITITNHLKVGTRTYRRTSNGEWEIWIRTSYGNTWQYAEAPGIQDLLDELYKYKVTDKILQLMETPE